MESFKDAYQSIVEERQKVLDAIKCLEENEEVRRYLELCEQDRELDLKQFKLSLLIEKEKYQNCDHIWITTKDDGRHKPTCSCIKCGLNYSVLDGAYSETAKVMRRVIEDSYSGNGKMLKTSVDASDIYCDELLARAIFSKLKEHHPDCTDEELVYYLRVALDDIRNIRVSEERKESRAKRLSLPSAFHSWDGSSVQSY